MDPSTKRVLITGGAGFIGSHMILHLLRTYPDIVVVNMDKLDYCSSEHYFKEYLENHNAIAADGTVSRARDRYHFVQGNVGSADLVRYVLLTYRINVVMHFAAQTHVDLSFDNAIDFTMNNSVATHVLIECARRYGGLERFIHVSTDEVYGESAYTEFTDETALLQPTNPYAASKMAAEAMVQSYRKAFQMPLIIVRCNNVYGSHQFPEKLIPKFITLLDRKLPCSIHGSGSVRRSFIHVDDVVRAYDLILTHGKLGEIYNIESKDELTVLQVAREILKQRLILENEADAQHTKTGNNTTGQHGLNGTIIRHESPDDTIIHHQSPDGTIAQREPDATALEHQLDDAMALHLNYVRDRELNDLRYAIDGTKLQRLGFQQNVSFADGIRRTIQWYREHDCDLVWNRDRVFRALDPHPQQ